MVCQLKKKIEKRNSLHTMLLFLKFFYSLIFSYILPLSNSIHFLPCILSIHNGYIFFVTFKDENLDTRHLWQQGVCGMEIRNKFEMCNNIETSKTIFSALNISYKNAMAIIEKLFWLRELLCINCVFNNGKNMLRFI